MTEARNFVSLGIRPEFQEILALQNIIVPTEVQARTIPAILAGRNLVVQSPTGTGKTLAYLLPLMEKISIGGRYLEVLVLAPSRELAVQVVGVARELAGERFKAVALIGGASQARQLDVLKEKPQIAVGTPGRVLDLLKKRKINAQAVRAVVVDEADKMLSAGFMKDVAAILKATLKTRQVLFFSATISREIIEKAPGLMQEPEFIIIDSGGRIPASIRHLYVMCDGTRRTETLSRLLNSFRPRKSLVFIQHSEGTGPLAGRLQELGFAAAALHSELSPLHRRDVLRAFRRGKAAVLVTTDLLARGMDVENIEFVFNYDLPPDEEFYLHRAGRTGRAGNLGTVVTLVEERQKFVIAKFEKYLRRRFIQVGLDRENRVFEIKYRHKNNNSSQMRPGDKKENPKKGGSGALDG
ncbi:MAG: DEAD/DEAH box helicase [Peptococcaceae bacterium]|jgi:superfamily II DNA/RNA helicase|nr:DEAD/DEAH box helicase [Peptococcaceae bacterium]MDH7524685.1 DEAD/DEAH box helicase [Peptococcaceae bacterium]